MRAHQDNRGVLESQRHVHEVPSQIRGAELLPTAVHIDVYGSSPKQHRERCLVGVLRTGGGNQVIIACLEYKPV